MCVGFKLRSGGSITLIETNLYDKLGHEAANQLTDQCKQHLQKAFINFFHSVEVHI